MDSTLKTIGRLRRGLRRGAGLVTMALLPACGGSKVFVNFPEGSPPPGEKKPAAAAPSAPAPSASGDPPAAAPPAQAVPAAVPADPLLPYWVLYKTWWGDHRDLLRKLESTSFSVPGTEKLFLRSEESLREIGGRLGEKDRADLERYVERYDDLRKDALRDTNRGILRQRLEGLGKEISRRFSEEPPRDKN